MSIQAVAWALKQRTGSPTLKAVLLAVANYVDEDGVCWPSQERLAYDTEITDRSVRDALKKLEEKGFLKRTPRFDEGYKRRTDLIQLIQTSHRKILPVDEPPEPDAKTTGSSRQKPPEGRSGKPSVEPSVEPSVLAIARTARECTFPNCSCASPDDCGMTTKAVVAKPKVKPKKAPATKTTIPDDFTLSTDLLYFCQNEGYDDGQAQRHFEHFVDDAHQHARRYSHWNLAFKNWIRNVPRFDRSGRSALGESRQRDRSTFRVFDRMHTAIQERKRHDDGGPVDVPF